MIQNISTVFPNTYENFEKKNEFSKIPKVLQTFFVKKKMTFSGAPWALNKDKKRGG